MFIVRTDGQEPALKCIPLQHVYCNSGHSTPILEGALGQSANDKRTWKKFKLPISQGAERHHAWRRSSYEQTGRGPPHYAFHCYMYAVIVAIAILEGAQVGVQTANALEKICKLPTSRGSQRHHA